MLKVPLNRVVAFLGPYIAVVSGGVAAWLVGQVNLLGLPDLGLSQSQLATDVAAGGTWLLTSSLVWLGHAKWLTGHHIELKTAALVSARTTTPLPRAVPTGTSVEPAALPARTGARACFDVPPGLDLESDSCGLPAALVRSTAAQRAASKMWLPEGHHWDLHIEHDHRVTTGPFIAVADWKWTWHITVSPWETVDSMREVLHEKAAEVHFVIGARDGVQHPVVIQCLPLDQYGKGLMHPAGTPETNRARTIQCEVCADEETIRSFGHYNALANLFALVTHGEDARVPVPNRLARSFSNPKRFTPAGYLRVSGHHGHMHVPNNDHVDPTSAFDGELLRRAVASTPHDL